MTLVNKDHQYACASVYRVIVYFKL